MLRFVVCDSQPRRLDFQHRQPRQKVIRLPKENKRTLQEIFSFTLISVRNVSPVAPYKLILSKPKNENTRHEWGGCSILRASCLKRISSIGQPSWLRKN